MSRNAGIQYLANMGNIIQLANCNKRDEYKQKNEKWYEHEPQTLTEKDNITILWDIPVQTDCEIKPTDQTL